MDGRPSPTMTAGVCGCNEISDWVASELKQSNLGKLVVSHSLVIHPNVEEQRLEIFRVLEDGENHLYTYVELRSPDGGLRSYGDVATQLGECLLLDLELCRQLP
jgi:hypothetical protein